MQLGLDSARDAPAFVLTPPRQLFTDCSLGPAPLGVDVHELEQFQLTLILVALFRHLPDLAPRLLASSSLQFCFIGERSHHGIDRCAAVFVEPDHPR